MKKTLFVVEIKNGFETRTCDLDSCDPSDWRPCPYCGSHGYGHIEDGLWFITCVSCKAETRGYRNNISAARAWQRKNVYQSAQIQGRLF